MTINLTTKQIQNLCEITGNSYDTILPEQVQYMIDMILASPVDEEESHNIEQCRGYKQG